MHARWITMAIGLFVLMPFAAQPADGLYITGAAAIFTFTDDGVATLREGPGWDCTDAVQNPDGTWMTECMPENLQAGPQSRATHPICEDARAVAGGTPVSQGFAYAKVSCGTLSADCEGEWFGWGQCVASLTGGPYPLPLVCTAKVVGKTTGGTLYAECSNGGAGAAPSLVPEHPSPHTGGAMWFEEANEPPAVASAPLWTCQGPFGVGDEWEIQCAPDPIAGGEARPCAMPFGVVGGTPVTTGSGRVRAACAGVTEVSCASAWVGAGGCFANPPFAVFPDSFPLSCRGKAEGTADSRGRLFVLCGTTV